MSDVAFHIYDAADGSGFVEVRSLATTGRTCSDRIDILNSSGYADGQQFGGVWQVVSPASSASDWGFPNAGCSVSGSPGGTCWNGTNITMTRTCR
ncbi:hypothetical protein WME77_19210 [Sorangium sp. So ce764]|uniref:hypothetical protein n=1 Tax=Sorangium sp. So ce764 TaxID=3133320 RepID=UPI003F5FBBF5